jgi:hypothetical protein
MPNILSEMIECFWAVVVVGNTIEVFGATVKAANSYAKYLEDRTAMHQQDKFLPFSITDLWKKVH